jgi:2-amino-4-hydroxy-6-hydroxymethyldihydropteridine diphosphokinase
MTTVYLALGSNVGDSRAYIEQAVELLGEKLLRIERAPLYRSKAVGYTDQADFINTALKADTELSPRELLAFIKEVEQRLGRQERFRWGPREIDIDIILFGRVIHEVRGLTVPHPLFRERDFVLVPLNDIAPEARDPVTNRTPGELLARLDDNLRTALQKVD